MSVQAWLCVSIEQQRLWRVRGRPNAAMTWAQIQDNSDWTCQISSGRRGVGQAKNSGQTPLGWHQIRAKIGEGQPINTVFKGRRPTGEIYSPALGARFPDRDWILTRILWLSGLEPGVNRLGDKDTMQRFIYIHGTPETEPMGRPLSHGCIRLHNQAMCQLFDRVIPGMRVWVGV